MSEQDQPGPSDPPRAPPVLSPSAAKANLLAWAQEHDANAIKARSSAGAIAITSALAILGGMAISGKLSQRGPAAPPAAVAKGVGQRLIRWTLAARAGQWVLSYGVGALLKYAKYRMTK